MISKFNSGAPTLKNTLARFAAPLAVATTLATGGVLAGTGDAEAGACLKLGEDVQICFDGNNVSGGGGGDRAPAYDPYVQTINITTHTGSREKLLQYFYPNKTRPDITRVCLVNRRGGQRSLAHSVSGINTLRANPGNKSCANFPSSARVRFVPLTNADRARPAKPLVYSLSQYRGGLLSLIWN